MPVTLDRVVSYPKLAVIRLMQGSQSFEICETMLAITALQAATVVTMLNIRITHAHNLKTASIETCR